jgi:hypothetical protein
VPTILRLTIIQQSYGFCKKIYNKMKKSNNKNILKQVSDLNYVACTVTYNYVKDLSKNLMNFTVSVA